MIVSINNKATNNNTGYKMVYKIYDTQSKCFTKGEYSTFNRAQRKADKLDLVYGAIRYVVKSINQ